MFEYIYTRIYNDEYGWMVNNPTKLDSQNEPLILGKVINENYPNKFFNLKCYGDKINVFFKEELSENEQFMLGQSISNYQTIGE